MGTITITIDNLELHDMMKALSQLDDRLPRVAPNEIKPTSSADEFEGWHPEKVKFLRRHRSVAELLTAFRAYLVAQVPEAKLEQNLRTVTITMPRGLQAGLWLRADGLLLHCQRGASGPNAEIHEFPIRSERDFAGAEGWLNTLPPYKD